MHRSSTTTHYALAIKKINHLRDARIEAAVAEYAQFMLDLDNVDFNELDKRIGEAKQGGFPPPLQRIDNLRTVAHVPEAKGNFTW